MISSINHQNQLPISQSSTTQPTSPQEVKREMKWGQILEPHSSPTIQFIHTNSSTHTHTHTPITTLQVRKVSNTQATYFSLIIPHHNPHHTNLLPLHPSFLIHTHTPSLSFILITPTKPNHMLQLQWQPHGSYCTSEWYVHSHLHLDSIDMQFCPRQKGYARTALAALCCIVLSPVDLRLSRVELSWSRASCLSVSSPYVQKHMNILLLSLPSFPSFISSYSIRSKPLL